MKIWPPNALKMCLGSFALIYDSHISVIFLPVQKCQNFLSISETLKILCEATQRSQWHFLPNVVNISSTAFLRLYTYCSVMLGSLESRCLICWPFNSFFKAFSCVADYSWCSRLYNCFYWCSHGVEDVCIGLLGCDVMWTCRWVPTFQRNILPPAPKMEAMFFLQNTVSHLEVHVASQPRRPTWTA
jgi:hypothetical protein